VHELVVAKIDAHVRKAASLGVEEDEITRKKILPAYRHRGATHLFAAARENQPCRLMEDMAHKAAAVHAGFGKIPAPAVSDTHQGECPHDHLGGKRGLGGRQISTSFGALPSGPGKGRLATLAPRGTQRQSTSQGRIDHRKRLYWRRLHDHDCQKQQGNTTHHGRRLPEASPAVKAFFCLYGALS